MRERRDVWHVVCDDENVHLIAADYGIKDWRLIWDHPDNAPVKELRRDPYQLHAGDRVFIPELEPKVFDVVTDESHRFVLHQPKMLLHLVLHDEFNQPLGGVTYVIFREGKRYDPPGAPVPLRTADDGTVSHMVPVSRAYELHFGPFADGSVHSLEYHAGHLDPPETPGGVRDRLHHLGYDEAAGAGSASDGDAIRRLQLAHGLEPTGAMDRSTRDLLAALHGN
jgi:hypothetical protein